MKNGQKIDLGLTGYDELFMTDQERQENRLPKIYDMCPAVELSYLSKEEQSALADVMSYMDCTPSHDQAIRMRKMSEDGKLTPEAIEAIMGEAKPNQREKISFRADRLRQFIPKNISPSQTEDYVMKALEHYSRYLEQVKKRNEAR